MGRLNGCSMCASVCSSLNRSSAGAPPGPESRQQKRMNAGLTGQRAAGLLLIIEQAGQLLRISRHRVHDEHRLGCTGGRSNGSAKK